jgi:hypothetical protein
MDAFRFSPELFETRIDVMQALNDAGFAWLSHYSSIDPIHDLYGIEVCGIIEQDDASQILEILCRMFPEWEFSDLRHKDYGREPGWKAIIHRDEEREEESWETA